MAEAVRRSITRRAVVAGAAAVSAGIATSGPEAAVARMERSAIRGNPAATPAPDFALRPAEGPDPKAPSGLQPADPIHAAIATHARAYAPYAAQLKDDPGNDEAMEPLCVFERQAAEKFAETVPATLEGAGAALAYVRLLHTRDDHPLLDDFHCYVFIASTETAVRRALDRGP